MFNENLNTTGANFGYLDQKTLLEYVSEEDIFELVFGYKPEEYDYVVSPLRPEDTSPGCWFERDFGGRLKFTDFGSNTVIRGKVRVNLDCFDLVQYYFNLPTFYSTLVFIKEKLIDGKAIEVIQKESKPTIKKIKPDFEIYFEPRDFQLRDKEYWQDRYGISKQNLIEDKVFCIDRYKTVGSKGSHIFTPKDVVYAYAEFKSKHIKLYQPFGDIRFLTNCNSNDIGGLHKYRQDSDTLVITKSYKDWRVLTNLNLNSIWFQSESMFPTLEVLLPYCFHHKEIVIFFDNDETGINNTKNLTQLINSYFPNKARSLVIPYQLNSQGISDPSDLMHKQGRLELLKFAKGNNLI